MFYSHTFLARKSPLGTVWIAAHLQHKLRKNHVSGTDISITVDKIMLSDVPIALRLSAHLLLGVVRIYSKKVDYLLHDCNEIYTRIRVMFASRADVNLPEDATCAPFHAITLPETFELDALDLDDAPYHKEVLDNHVSTYDDITLPDQVPGDADPYVTFYLNEDIRMDVFSPERIPDNGFELDDRVRPMDEDAPTNQVSGDFDVSHHPPVNQPEELNKNTPEDLPLGDPPEIEVMREAGNDFVPVNLLEFDNDATEQLSSSHQTTNDKVNLSPVMEDVPDSVQQSLPPQLNADPPSVGSLPTLENSNASASTGFALGNMSLDLAIQPTPPVQQQQPKTRKRKRNFDTSVVLSNKFMKEGLKNPSGLLRKRKNLPCSSLDVWTFNKRLRTDQVFFEPCISGMCTNLEDVFRKELLKVHTVHVEDTHVESNGSDPEEGSVPQVDANVKSTGTVPQVDANVESTGTVPLEDTHQLGGTVSLEDTHLQCSGAVNVEDSHLEAIDGKTFPLSEQDLEIEHIRFAENQENGSSFQDFMASPFRGDEFTPFPSTDKGSEPPTGTTLGTEPLSTVERSMSSAEPTHSEMETPMTRFENEFALEGSGLSGIPELQTSAEEEDLYFLDGDSTPDGYTENEAHTLSVRTRAVAQYLKDQSPTNEVSKNPPRELSLNKILEGKRRKTCARMFFETLVLKSHGLIDVRQEEPYSDVSLLLDPLSNANF